MGVEIERKFLLKNEDWKENAGEGVVIKQAYLTTNPERTVRVRLKGEKAFLTIKGKTMKATRSEFEYEIPVVDAHQLITLCEQPIIDKIRYERIWIDKKCWEIDVFYGENYGLVLAECELTSEQEDIDIPPWIGVEVTSDKRYYNANLIKNPYKNWNAP